MKNKITSLQRVLTTLGQKEPDRVPLFLLFSYYGAKELGIEIKDYFSNSENVVEAQLKLTEKFNNDCFYTFSYASAEIEAFGGSTIFAKETPPNAGVPIISNGKQIEKLQVPEIHESKALVTILDTIKKLKYETQDSKPIIGVAVSPFSLPIMQMGFDKYLDLLYSEPLLFEKLMAINEQFCVNWANAQVEAGAMAVCYFDPVSSPTVLPRSMFLEKGFELTKRTISKIKAPVATHFASGRAMPIIQDLAKTGTHILGASSDEDIGELKRKAEGKLSLLGNLNGIEMCRWTEAEAEQAVKDIIYKAGKGGGLIIADNHGEIPYQVSEKILYKISESVQKWGKYPLTWVK